MVYPCYNFYLMQTQFPKKGYIFISVKFKLMDYREEIIGSNVTSIVEPFKIKITELKLSREGSLTTFSEEDLITEWPRLKIPIPFAVNYVHAYVSMEIDADTIEGASKILVEANARYIIDMDTGQVKILKYKIIQSVLPQGLSWSNTIENFIERYGAIVFAVIRALLERFR